MYLKITNKIRSNNVTTTNLHAQGLGYMKKTSSIVLDSSALDNFWNSMTHFCTLNSRINETHKGWYAQRRRTFRLESIPDFSRCAMLLNAPISGILAAT